MGWGFFGICNFYSWRLLEEIRGFTPLGVSAQYTPALICGPLAAGASGFRLTHTPVSFTIMVAIIALFLGQLITVTQPAKQIYWAQMFFVIVIVPLSEDVSLRAGTVIGSTSMQHEHQGLAASLIYTMVYYSISIALDITEDVEVHVKNHSATPEDMMFGIRCAWCTGVILAGCGVMLGALYFGRTLLREGWRVRYH
ncbi:hypothetical protein DOTSEDRAFT_21397 [Dothistroma septosporum NZE10]|uniref:Uncharacterized protein n=1 Tax=Dothistroma septosporum (strain NZE10 / CBS 128990) TaxID=675120 RepID=N1PW82_DOTSN|nr:hypothetical protein DOTSEDRAFT_21397 [Dothistroma septosporum NZE10]